MTEFMAIETEMPGFLMFPRFLLDADISETSKLVYLVLLNRARMSQMHEGWTDAEGRVFLVFPIVELMQILHKSETTIKTCLKALDKAGWIQRKHQGIGKPDRIYVKLPVGGGKLPVRKAENELPQEQKPVSATGRKPYSNHNDKARITQSQERKLDRAPYGAYENVFLSHEELANLRCSVAGWDSYIEKLSRYMKTTGKQYSNHYATIRGWARRDNKVFIRPQYECKENESL